MTIEIVDIPYFNLVIFHSYVNLPEGIFDDQWEFQDPTVEVLYTIFDVPYRFLKGPSLMMSSMKQ